jgi:hypothetical protein
MESMTTFSRKVILKMAEITRSSVRQEFVRYLSFDRDLFMFFTSFHLNGTLLFIVPIAVQAFLLLFPRILMIDFIFISHVSFPRVIHFSLLSARGPLFYSSPYILPSSSSSRFVTPLLVRLPAPLGYIATKVMGALGFFTTLEKDFCAFPQRWPT